MFDQCQKDFFVSSWISYEQTNKPSRRKSKFHSIYTLIFIQQERNLFFIRIFEWKEVIAKENYLSFSVYLMSLPTNKTI